MGKYRILFGLYLTAMASFTVGLILIMKSFEGCNQNHITFAVGFFLTMLSGAAFATFFMETDK